MLEITTTTEKLQRNMTGKLPKPTKRNSKSICGQLWHFRVTKYRVADTMGNYTAGTVYATRYSDGRSVCGSARDKLESVIAERIQQGIY